MRKFIKVSLFIGLAAIIFGCILLAVAYFSGLTFKAGKRYSFDESYDDVKSLIIDMQYADVKITEGDNFRIEARKLLDESDFISGVSDGVWEIREKNSSEVNVFGLKLPFQPAYGDDYIPDIVITVPEGFEADEIIIDIGAGKLKGENIRARTGKFRVGAGALMIDGLVIPEGSEYNIGTGHMEISGLEADDITVECRIGDIELNGIVTGDSRVDCGIGRVLMELDADKDDYSYEIGTVVGSINIDGKSYHGNRRERKVDRGSLGSFRLDCRIGNININFN